MIILKLKSGRINLQFEIDLFVDKNYNTQMFCN